MTESTYCCETCEAFKHYIDKCTDEIKKIDYCVSQVSELTQVFGEGLTQKRLDFVCALKDRIDFILKNPKTECIV